MIHILGYTEEQHGRQRVELALTSRHKTRPSKYREFYDSDTQHNCNMSSDVTCNGCITWVMQEEFLYWTGFSMYHSELVLLDGAQPSP